MTIVTAELVFADDRFRRRHAFAMMGGRILTTGTPAELADLYPDEDLEDWGRVAVLPGTVNAHTHAIQILLRGRGDDLSPGAWRDRVIGPFSEGVDADVVGAGAELAFAQMARAGVTTVVDFFSLHDGANELATAAIDAARRVGIRIVLARRMTDWAGAPRRAQESADLAARNTRALAEALRGDPRAFAIPAPHSVDGASPDLLVAAAALAEELDTPFAIHVAERLEDRERSIERRGMTPVRFLDALGVLSGRTLLVHAVWCDDDDLALISERGAKVIHSPSANAFLGAGIAPLRRTLERSIPVALGTGGGASGGTQSVFEEMRMAALLGKAVAADAAAITGREVMLAGTARGGELLGLPVGRIAADHAADLVVVDLDALSLQPAETAEQQIVYAMQSDAIRRVLVGGEPVAENGRAIRLSEADLRSRVARAAPVPARVPAPADA